MAELEIITGPQNSQISEVNGAVQTQGNASPESWQPSMWKPSKKLCIYRVPKSLRISNEAAYVPFVVSLGPYHHEVKTKLTAMHQHKLEAVNILSKSFNLDKKSVIEEIARSDSDIRECYDEAIECDKYSLAELLAMDVFFIIQFFMSYHKGNTVRFDILNDIMKLENQIPLFILKAILRLIYKTDDEVTYQLTQLLLGVFNRFPFGDTSTREVAFDQLKGYIEKAPVHLLDLKRMMVADLLSAAAVQPNDSANAHSINCAHSSREWCANLVQKFWPAHSHENSTPCAELLQKAGIQFQPGDIRFESGKLSLPPIGVDDNTEIVLRNLMAYEECQRCSLSPESTVISHFVIFLDDLIESEKDVSILKENGIITHFLGSDNEVANTFNQLCKGITMDHNNNRFMFQSAARQATKYYYSPWKKPIRRVKERYFSEPLYWVPMLAGTAILVMTAVQMVYAIKGG